MEKQMSLDELKQLKKLLINTPQGQYTLPLEEVAKHRAYYYVQEDGDYDEAFNFVMNDDFEGIDWLLNNTDWADWEKLATKVNDKVLVTDDDFWTSSNDVEIIISEPSN